MDVIYFYSFSAHSLCRSPSTTSEPLACLQSSQLDAVCRRRRSSESVELDNAVSSCLIEGPNKTELHVNDLSLLGKYRRWFPFLSRIVEVSIRSITCRWEWFPCAYRWTISARCRLIWRGTGDEAFLRKSWTGSLALLKFRSKQFSSHHLLAVCVSECGVYLSVCPRLYQFLYQLYMFE